MENITYSWFVSEPTDGHVDIALIVYKNGIQNDNISIDYIFSEHEGDEQYELWYHYKNPVNMQNNTVLTSETTRPIQFFFEKIQVKSDTCEEFFIPYSDNVIINITKFVSTNYYYKGNCYRKQTLTTNEGIFYANDVELYNDFTITQSNVFAEVVNLLGYTLTCGETVVFDNEETSCTIKNGTIKSSNLKLNNPSFLLENVVLDNVSLQLSERTSLYLKDTVWNTRPTLEPFIIYGRETFNNGFSCDAFPSTADDTKIIIRGPVCKKDGTAISLE